MATSTLETTHAARKTGERGSLRAWLSDLRRRLLPSDEELDLAYLEGASDRYELEYRIREIDRRQARRVREFR
jgi:hypothetical protein